MLQTNHFSGYRRVISRLECWMTSYWDDLYALPQCPSQAKDGRFLPTFRGQIIEITENCGCSQWSYGRVLFDPKARDIFPNVLEGWFPMVLSKPASITKLQEKQSFLHPFIGKISCMDTTPPAHWKYHRGNKLPHRVQVPQESVEFSKVGSQFLDSIPPSRFKDYEVVKIERIQLLDLWLNYQLVKDSMERQCDDSPSVANNGRRTVEKILFHGTFRWAAPKICRKGFKLLCAGVNGSLYGRGIYFAVPADTAMTYSPRGRCSVTRSVFMCRVATGDWCKGTSNQTAPDVHPEHSCRTFDCSVDDSKDPQVYVVYHDAQAYPEYLISFKERATKFWLRSP